MAKGEPLETWRLFLRNFLPPGLNGAEGLIRRHYRHRRSDKEAIKFRVISANGGPLRPVRTPCRITYTRLYCPHPMDWANAAASIKNLEDCLVELGVIPDDSPRYVTGLDVRQVKVDSVTTRGVLLELTYEPGDE